MRRDAGNWTDRRHECSAYSAPFDEERTRGWITWNLKNYEKYGFGLWAVVLKETGEFIGDCGISIQNIDGEMLPEIGYHIHKMY